jgi:Rho-binding antiterminator
MPDSTYTPISCSFYDELEARATTGQRCQLTYLTEADSPPSTYEGTITDLFIRDKVEYLRLADGFELRLDALVAVDDKELRNYC